MEFKYKKAKVKIIKVKLSSLRANSIVAIAKQGSSKNFKFDEDNVRQAYLDALNIANKKGLKSITFLISAERRDRPWLEANAKIMAQEVLRAIKDSKSNLREVIFVLTDEASLRVFRKIVFGYLKYITEKLSDGPFSTVDIIIQINRGIILIERSNPPFGWALPGGFVDYAESLEETAKREAKEETSLNVYKLKQFHTYSKPGRDPRFHTISTIFTAKAKGRPKARSDAKDIGVFSLSEIRKMKLAFDHNRIIQDYFRSK